MNLEKNVFNTLWIVKRKKIIILKFNKKHDCTLIITEGDSAAGFARNGIQVLTDDEKKKIGIFPSRGKFINAR